MKVADQVIKSLNAHRWQSDAAPHAAGPVDSASILRGPHAWTLKNLADGRH